MTLADVGYPVLALLFAWVCWLEFVKILIFITVDIFKHTAKKKNNETSRPNFTWSVWYHLKSVSIPDESYSRNAYCTLILMFTFLLRKLKHLLVCLLLIYYICDNIWMILEMVLNTYPIFMVSRLYENWTFLFSLYIYLIAICISRITFIRYA
jgi:hypothetical protein